MTRLLIISAMPHHLRDGVVVGWAPTVREIDQLATRFTTVRHVACLYPGAAPANAVAYRADNLELVAVPPSGAPGLLGKLDVIRNSATYVRTILRELRDADMVHVRAPANIALIAMLVLGARKRDLPRWFKYAGNWRPTRRESPSYTLQRWWLEQPWHRGLVTISGHWPEQPAWVRTFYNPSLDRADIERGQRAAQTKQLTSPIRLLYVGRVETSKGAGRAIEVVGQLAQRGIAATLELVGDGEESAQFVALAAQLGVTDRVAFLGWQSPDAVAQAYERAHVLLLPTASEGWPKVLSEGMAYGCVPVAGAVSAIPQYLREMETGRALPPTQVSAFADAIADYAHDPALWQRESARAAATTQRFSYDSYLASVDAMLDELGVA